MTGQYVFEVNGDINVIPSKLSECREAREPKPKQLELSDWAEDADKLTAWTLATNDELAEEEMT